jgi:hypothetical protein
MSVTDLLTYQAHQAAESPFGFLPRFPGASLRESWLKIVLAIQQPSGPSTTQLPAWIYAKHLVVITVLFVVAFSTRQYRFRGQQLGSQLTPSKLVLVFAFVHILLTPLYYGVLLKSYRYPRAQIFQPASSDGVHDWEFVDNPPFLIVGGGSEIVLYDRATREWIAFDKSRVQYVRVMADDSLFSVPAR